MTKWYVKDNKFLVNPNKSGRNRNDYYFTCIECYELVEKDTRKDLF